jgi:peroxiredoxin
MRVLIVIGLLICLFSGVWAEPPPPVTGASLAQMALFDLQGKRHGMAAVTTKRVVVVFWAYWCDTWKTALPHLRALNAEREALDCTIWTVSVDGTYTAEVRPLARTIPFPLLLDTGAWKVKLGLRRVPTVMILDTNRTVVKVYEGYPGNAVLMSALRQVR